MAEKRINESPTIADTVLFDIPTPGADGCFTANPYKVDKVTIYFVDRNFALGGDLRYDNATTDQAKEDAAQAAKALACTFPTPDNIDKAKKARDEADNSSQVSTFYYNEAQAVAIFGTEDFPAWLSTDTGNALITNVGTDSSGNPQFGHFELEWTPLGMREGDYFICWTWTPNPAGDSLSNFVHFSLLGATQLTTSIPTHITDPKKYQILFERYLPEMFKMHMLDGDLSPEVIDQYNKALALQFTDLENLANQIPDLTDANATHEAFLPLLANTFNWKLKSEDPTLWRRQIRQSVPLYKRKGTLGGMRDALATAGIRLAKMTKMWQVVSLYTWIESFKATEGQTEFPLVRIALPVDLNNFGLWLRLADTTDYVSVDPSNASFDTSEGVTTMTWLGDALVAGDIVRVMYLYADVPDATQQTIENYVRTLPTADQRDEVDQLYPFKNWNVRLIEEDDPLIDVVIQNRHPFHDPIIWGMIRTEFPYSENAYNMDEYNGSTRTSLNPCDIGRDFLDPCGYCQSSKFILDIEIDNLSNHRMTEAQDIIREFSPFHAVLHSLNFSGTLEDIVQPPVETIEALITIRGEESVIAGGAQMIFSRSIHRGLTTEQVTRSMLANVSTPESGTGTASNDAVALYCNAVYFDKLGLDVNNLLLEVLAPSIYAGSYTMLSNPSHNTIEVQGVTEPVLPPSLSGTLFTFRLSTVLYNTTLASIDNADVKFLGDVEQNWAELGIESQFDVDEGTATAAYVASIPAYSATPYTILDILPDGTLLLDDPDDTLPLTTVTGVSYTIKNPADTVVASSTGRLTAVRRGKVTLPLTVDIRTVCTFGDYLGYSGQQYFISGFVPGSTTELYIDGYTGGSAAGQTVTLYRRVVRDSTGNFGYKGMTLDAVIAAPIVDTDDPSALEDDHFKENYMIRIGSDYFTIAAKDGTNYSLGGPHTDWGTAGQTVNYTVYWYQKQNDVTVTEGTVTHPVDRRGKEIISSVTETTMPMMFRAHALNTANRNEIVDTVGQEESISYQIEYADGTVQEGEI